MAVFTHVSDTDAKTLLSSYDVGAFASLTGITQGVENTNYILQTTQQKLILTLIERRVESSDLSFFTQLLSHMAQSNIPCPQPVLPTHQGAITLHNKPVLMVSFLDGQQQPTPTTQHVQALGSMIATMHQSLSAFPHARANPIGAEQWQALQSKLGDKLASLSPTLPKLATSITQQCIDLWPTLPHQQLIHADAFTDNVFFAANGAVSGIIDWYFTCTAPRLYELAIMMCDWCFSKDNHTWLPAHAAALMQGYQQHISLTNDELQHLPLLCQAAALRFLLTRAEDTFFPRADAEVVMKDPQEYIQKLEFFSHANANRFIAGTHS